MLTAAVARLSGDRWSGVWLDDGGQLLPTAVVAAQAPSDTYKNVYDGWKWWHVYCYRCHGANAIGTTNAPNLIDPNRKAHALPQFLKIVRDGIPDKGMQAWDKLLDDEADQPDSPVRAGEDRQGAAAGTAG